MAYRKKKQYGLIISTRSNKDYKYIMSGSVLESVDLSKKSDPVHDQYPYNSCVAFATGELLEEHLLATVPDYNIKWKDWNISQAFIWACARYTEGTITKNSGVILRNAFKYIQKYGFLSKDQWDFKNGVYRMPSISMMNLAAIHLKFLPHLPKYYRLSDNKKYKVNQIKDCLSNGFKVVLGIPIYDNFESYRSGVLREWKGTLKGYHAVVVVGYNQDSESNGVVFKIKNSWSNYWGDGGYFHISEDLIKQHTYDIWTMKKGDD